MVGSQWAGPLPATTLVKACSCGWTQRATARSPADVVRVIRELGQAEHDHLANRNRS